MPTWVIIGASRGIGYQYLKTLSRDPSNLVVGLVRVPEETKAKVAADNLPNVRILHGDLTDAASLRAAAKEVATFANDTVDYLIVNGAYIGMPTMNHKNSDYVGPEKEALLLSDFDLCMRTNVMGPLHSINAFMPLVLKSSVKKIVCISSGAADNDFNIAAALDNQLPYAASKAALGIMVGKSSIEYKDQGVIIISMAPGYVLTLADSVDDLPPYLNTLFKGFTSNFQKMNPDLKGPLNGEQALEQHLKVIENLTLEQTGQFLSQFGNKVLL